MATTETRDTRASANNPEPEAKAGTQAATPAPAPDNNAVERERAAIVAYLKSTPIPKEDAEGAVRRMVSDIEGGKHIVK